MRSNYNKMEYCLGNGFELLSASTVLAVCQDSLTKEIVLRLVYRTAVGTN